MASFANVIANRRSRVYHGPSCYPLGYAFDLISYRKRTILGLLLNRLTRRKASVGLFFGLFMPAEPTVKLVIGPPTKDTS